MSNFAFFIFDFYMMICSIFFYVFMQNYRCLLKASIHFQSAKIFSQVDICLSKANIHFQSENLFSKKYLLNRHDIFNLLCLKYNWIFYFQAPIIFTGRENIFSAKFLYLILFFQNIIVTKIIMST